MVAAGFRHKQAGRRRGGVVSGDRVLHVYLGPSGRALVEARAPRMVTRVVEAVEAAGWEIRLMPDEAREGIAGREGHHLVINQEVPGPRCVTLRKAYLDPFWRLEVTNDRWDWEIAGQVFDPAAVGQKPAQQFQNYWRKRLFEGQRIGSGGGIFVPLQGKLLQRRHFQAASPVEMLAEIRAHWPDRPILATLHPGESYSEEERAAVQKLVGISDRPSMELLAGCDLVVTENSGVAVKGFFADKPALLFGRIDFHHIAASVPRDGLARALAEAGRPQDFAAYLHWFLKENALLFWAENLRERIQARLRALGWPI